MLLAAFCLFITFSPTAQLLRHAVFDTYQRVFPLERTTSPVAIVVIDENALLRYGQWPWPRTRMAELFERIAEHKPASIGMDIIFPERDRLSPPAIAAELAMLPQDARRILAQMPSNEERFAAAIRGRNVVLGISGEATRDPRFPEPPRAAPVVVTHESIKRGLRSYAGNTRSLETIDEAAAGRGLMNSGPADQVVRVVPLVANVQEQIVSSLGLESLRVALGAGMRLDTRADGLLGIRFGDVSTVAQDDGSTWLRYSPHDPQRFVSALSLFDGKAATDSLANKIVLVGVNGLGVLDFKTTPLGEFVTGVEIHAQVVENLFNGVTLTRPAIMPRVEVLALIICGFLLIAFVPRLSALQGINLAVGLVIVLLGGGIIAFLHFNLLFDFAWPAIGTVAVFGTVVVGTLSQAEQQRRQLREQAAHMAGEVDAARRIQMGLLPDPGQTMAEDRRFRVATLLEPARTVGGDFYDCFMVDERHLFLVVADVSGKGLPAALFMAAVKSHIKSAALRGGATGDVLTAAQEEITRENPEQLFVTAFAASLDLQTGMLDYGNAGHEPPFVRSPHGLPQRLSAPGGPPLCVVEDFRFPTDRKQLSPGDWMFVMTDGATEAMNPQSQFFGVERLRTSLSWMPEGVGPAELIKRLRDDVARFASGAELADDITMVALRWDGGAAPLADVDLDAAVARL
ncbi:MAG TPA: CHASE2 domain-containing protein [Usitatibacter sp.]|nr:CHASE2 domain-containing protein [Usitatibacter sp.]